MPQVDLSSNDVRIPGLTFRDYRGVVDHAVIVAVMNACNIVDRAEYNESIDDVHRVFSHLTNCDPSIDMVFAEVDGRPAGYSRVFWKNELDGPRLYISLGFVVPEWRRRGLGTLLLRWNESRLREIASEHPAGTEKVFHVWTTDAVPGAMALFEANGYTVARVLVGMTRPTSAPLPPARLPEGFDLRVARPEHYRKIWDAWEEAYQDHWGYAPRSASELEAWQQSRLFQPDLWRVAWAEDHVAGLILNYVDARRNQWIGVDRGYTQDIFVRRPWRRRGLARALLTESIRMFTRMGMSETYLGVDTESPTGANVLYESLGYRPYRKHFVYRKPMTLE